ncbi:MAG: hypothetical protein HYZ14_06305 [Bacteroidetes bacterium]|nr:hypothetical protein [Bacteroidota bacterium]
MRLFRLSALVAFWFVVQLCFLNCFRWSQLKNQFHKQTMHASCRFYPGRASGKKRKTGFQNNLLLSFVLIQKKQKIKACKTLRQKRSQKSGAAG